MKRLAFVMLLSLSCIFAFSQEAVYTKLNGMGVKNSTGKNNPAKNIKKMYIFNENNVKGGIIVFTLNEVKMDVFATVIQTGNDFKIMSVEPVNNTAYNKDMMSQLNGSFAKWNNVPESGIPDAVSSATKHSKGIYSEIQAAVVNGIAVLKK